MPNETNNENDFLHLRLFLQSGSGKMQFASSAPPLLCVYDYQIYIIILMSFPRLLKVSAFPFLFSLHLSSSADGLEDVKAVSSCRQYHSGDLRVPVNFLDVLLTLMNEQKLRRHDDSGFSHVLRCCFFVVSFDTEIPEGDGVVCTGGGEDGSVGRVPLDRGDWRFVPIELGDRSRLRSGSERANQKEEKDENRKQKSSEEIS